MHKSEKEKSWKRNDKKVATIMRINFFAKNKELYKRERKTKRERERES